MPVKKLPSGQWVSDFYIENRAEGKRGKRVRKKFATKGETLAYERYELDKLGGKPWVETNTKDTRKLRDLVEAWYKAHGITLSDGSKRHTTML